MMFVLGAKGSEWAWRNRRWESIEQFRRTQRRWGFYGLAVALLAAAAVVIDAVYPSSSPRSSSQPAIQSPLSGAHVVGWLTQYAVASGDRVTFNGTQGCEARSARGVTELDCGPVTRARQAPNGYGFSILDRQVELRDFLNGSSKRLVARAQPSSDKRIFVPAPNGPAGALEANPGDDFAVGGTGIFCETWGVVQVTLACGEASAISHAVYPTYPIGSYGALINPREAALVQWVSRGRRNHRGDFEGRNAYRLVVVRPYTHH
jgi:hypothetical protein